ncbi:MULTISPECIES: MBL fold metallo-hydrolase [unclassified Pseudomonas]|uniref:MBL fold metallo-hydrolase n=1 Tax=unclassified Pseudomonas TaxID=196821 RepID=UPI000DA7F997|nr:MULTISPECIES: MBL fold metallo-hydrolase [unclassified Pseudomonas]MDW3710632.1 MBL fold metallo-hydrolase [Pseudomonas sp. 2023EL-01195]PZE10933.1 MBL fold metallo-hydrolase [Pseudomonas sp. 57B-090624]
MLLRQLFDAQSSTYTYLLADAGEAVLIDPVKEQLDAYLRLLDELGLRLVLALDTHTHADHITALGDLREATGCQSGFGAQSGSTCASFTFADGARLRFGTRELIAWYTPGHTADSYCFLLPADPVDGTPARVFTGDTLLIRGTGRTDFQNGDARAQWASLQRLLALAGDTEVCPGHDYRGWTRSSIAEERAHNPRLQVADAEAYAALMASLRLPNPRLMDIAVPANRACGRP